MLLSNLSKLTLQIPVPIHGSIVLFQRVTGMDELFETIRENASKEVWSRGVELARQDAVSGDRRTDEEIILRVLERSRSVSTLVTLWPNEDDWSKDCSCKLDLQVGVKQRDETGLQQVRAHCH